MKEAFVVAIVSLCMGTILVAVTSFLVPSGGVCLVQTLEKT
jgi:hypothetical protein